MNTLTPEDLLRALSHVMDPELGRDLVTLGMIRDAQVEDGVAQFTLRLTTPACPIRDQLEERPAGTRQMTLVGNGCRRHD